jgi:hypothetical protein
MLPYYAFWASQAILKLAQSLKACWWLINPSIEFDITFADP